MKAQVITCVSCLTYQTDVWYKRHAPMGRTPRGETRKKVYDFVRRRLLDGLPPTVRDVQEAFDFRAVQTAREHLEALVEEGLLAKAAGRARGYSLPELGAHDTAPTRLVPLLGRVQAGHLTSAIQEPSGYLPIRSRRPEKELFALRVRGDSMNGAGILSDDIVIVRRQNHAENGEIVVALVEDEATIKRLHRRGSRIELRPENPEFRPIVPKAGELQLLGKVIEVHRYLDAPPLITAS
jgi:repressor LexA